MRAKGGECRREREREGRNGGEIVRERGGGKRRRGGKIERVEGEIVGGGAEREGEGEI